MRVAFASILTAVLVAMIAIAIQNPGIAVKATITTDLVTGFTSALNIALSYGPSSSMIPEYDAAQDYANSFQPATISSST